MTGFPDDPRDRAGGDPPGADPAGDDRAAGGRAGGRAAGGRAGAGGEGGPGAGTGPASGTEGAGPADGAGSASASGAGTGSGQGAGSGSGGSRADGGSGAGGSGSGVGAGFGAGAGSRYGPGPDHGSGTGFGRDLDDDLELGGFGPDGDPLKRLLRPAGEFLAAPPGAFERIRRRAGRRRRNRALAGGAVVAVLVTGSVYVAGALSPGSGEVVGPPATSHRITYAPTSSAPSPSPTPSPATPPVVTTTPGNGTSGPAGSTPPARPTPTSSRPTDSPTAVPTSRSTDPACTTDQLTATLGDGDAAAGNLYRYLVLTNTGGTACHLTGFPGLSLLDADGKQIGDPADREQIGYQPVTLAPGASASDTIHTANQQGTCLPASTTLRIYPPGSRQALLVPGRIAVCEGVFTVTPFTAGRTGNPPG
jgi:hypothetical protein